jgi:hypothetical protein
VSRPPHRLEDLQCGSADQGRRLQSEGPRLAHKGRYRSVPSYESVAGP